MPVLRCGTRRTCASTTPGRWPPGAPTWTRTGTRRSPRSARAPPGSGGCTWPARGWASTATTSSCTRCSACGWLPTGRPACRCGPTGTCPGCWPVNRPNGPRFSRPRRYQPRWRRARAAQTAGHPQAEFRDQHATGGHGRVKDMTGQQFAIVVRPFAEILLFMVVSDKRDPPDRRRRGRGDTMGGQTSWCAILCACVPSGCFLPSRADLPSLARLPLVSRGVFIAGAQSPRRFYRAGPDRFDGEETMTAAESTELAQRYDPRDVQEKWQARWAELDPFRAGEDPADPRERFYLVDMFPYPSGDLHMGHAEAYAIGDALARYWFLRGRNVLHPIGWDAFGLPAENAAIRNNSHPADWTYANIETQAASFRRYATSFDWSRRLQTCDPAYYRWNQWLFLRFYERGLAYRRDGYVNWCPVDQ